MDKYSDIVNLEYHKSNRHKQMSINDRAAQFMPFAALTGYSDAISEEGRIVSKKILLSDEQKDIIDEKLNYLSSNLSEEVKIVYFIKDNKKNGGKYVSITGYVKKIDKYNMKVIMTDKTSINISDIYDVNMLNIEM